MTLDLGNWPTLSRLLDEALDLPDAAARSRWLDALGAEHAGLRPVLARLLAAEGSERFERLPSLEDPAIDFSAGEQLGPYRLERQLGSGGMAVVWLATLADDPQAPPVALKLPQVSVNSSGFLERFARERGILAQLDHPNIAAFRDAGVAPSGQQYLAMEYIEGGTLADFCDARGLGVAQRLGIFRQVVSAVEHAHARQVIHRDIKPSNILVTPQGEARLLDFGVAKVLSGERATESTLTAAIGRPLTPEYASPEQLAGEPLTSASDIYSLGVVLHELLTGARPAAAAPGAPIAPPSAAVAEGTTVARAEGGARRLASRLRGDLDAVVTRALRSQPAERYASAQALGADIERFLAGKAVVPRGEAFRARARDFLTRHRAVAALVLIMLVTTNGMRGAHRAASDLQHLLEHPVPAAQQVALVTIGREDYARLFGSRSPLDPARLQTVVRKILEGRPSTLGVDIDTSDASFAALRQAFADANGRVVWARGATVDKPAGSLPVPQPVLGSGSSEATADSALAMAIVDFDDGVARRYSRHVRTSEGMQPSFASVVASAGQMGPEPRPGDESLGIRFTRTERAEFPASIVLADGFEWNGRIENRVVLLGGRYDRADVHRTPVGEMDGIDVVANIVETEMRGGGRRAPHLAKVIAIGMIELVVILLVFDHFSFFKALAVTVVGAAAFSWLLAVTGILPEWPYALFAMLLVVVNQFGIEVVRRQRQSLKDAFGALRRRLRPR